MKKINVLSRDEALALLSALSHSWRLDIYRELMEAGFKGMKSTDLAKKLNTSSPTLTFHCRILLKVGLIATHKEGRYLRYFANRGAMHDLLGYLNGHYTEDV